MPLNSWIPAGAGTWATTANWSLGATPANGDDVNFPNVSLPAGNSIITLPVSISRSYASFTYGTVGALGGGYLLSTGAGAPLSTFTWNLATAGAEYPINVAAGGVVGHFHSITGSGKLVKTGDGFAYWSSNGVVTTNFSGGLDVRAGKFGFGYGNNVTISFGTGAWTFSPGTTLSYGSSLGTTFNNAIALNGTVGSPVTLEGAVVGGEMTLAGAITGTAGFTKTGPASVYINPTTPANNTLTGTINVTGAAGVAGALAAAGPAAASIANINVFPGNGVSVPTINVAAANDWYIAYGSTQTRTVANAFTGLGGVTFSVYGTASTLNLTGDLAGLTGIQSDTGAADTGLRIAMAASGAGVTHTANISTFPATLGIATSATVAQATVNVNYVGTGVPTLQKIITYPSTATALTTAILSFNSSGTNAVTVPLGITRVAGSNSTSALSFRLGGTNLLDNEVSGPITTASGVTGALSITKADAGKWIFSGANTYTGTTTVSGGTLSAQSASALGTSGAVTVQTTGTLDISGGVSVTKSGTTLTLGGTGSPQLSSTTGSNTYNCAGITLNTTLPVSVASGAYLKLNNSSAMTGAFGLTKSGDGELDLGTTSNTYTGLVTVSTGTLTAGTLGNAGTASSLGTGSLATAIVLTGTLKYAGTSAGSTSRSLTLTGSAPALEAAGTTAAATATFSAYTHAAGARTLTLKGANTGNNTFSAALADNGASVVGLTKSGAGKWILSAQPTYSGVTTVSEGELQFNGLNLNFDLTMNGAGVLSNTVIAGASKTITCNGGTPEIVATTTGNTVTGTTSVTSGTLRLTTEQASGGKPVKVLGDTAVTVDGALRTSVGSVQRGQMRYGGNLTFNSGAALYIG